MPSSIPMEWIQNHVDQLLDIASKWDDNAMRRATLMRVEHILDMLEAYKEMHQNG